MCLEGITVGDPLDHGVEEPKGSFDSELEIDDGSFDQGGVGEVKIEPDPLQ